MDNLFVFARAVQVDQVGGGYPQKPMLRCRAAQRAECRSNGAGGGRIVAAIRAGVFCRINLALSEGCRARVGAKAVPKEMSFVQNIRRNAHFRGMCYRRTADLYCVENI